MLAIVRRELMDVLRSRKTLALQFLVALGCAALVLIRWPTGDVADLSGAAALQVLRIFGYGLLVSVLVLTPAFPATALVRERIKGTLPLLLNTPLRPWSIYFGKLAGLLAFTLMLLAMTLPAAAACYLLGGAAAQGGIVSLYAVLLLAGLQCATLGLLVSLHSQTTDGALRVTYGLVLVGSVLVLAPYLLLRGGSDWLTEAAAWLRCVSPIPAVMQLLGHADVGMHGMGPGADAITRYALLGGLTTIACALATITALRHRTLERSRPAGQMTEDRSAGQQALRRIFFLIDPQRRSAGISLWVNPIMVKEFRTRRFGRSHWMLRLVALCAILSLGLSYIAASGALGWGIEVIGGGLVLLQIALLILFTPSLAAGLVSSERESGSWQLLRMTPLSPGAIIRGKLLSVAWPLVLLLCATLPGYIVMMTIKPHLTPQVQRVVICLVLTSVFAMLLSAAVSTLFRSTAQAITVSYLVLMAICLAPLLVWLGRGAPFGHALVETVLLANPVAASLQASETPGFTQYQLLPFNWYLLGAGCILLLLFLAVRTWHLCRPE